jgi:hypothetical protein
MSKPGFKSSFLGKFWLSLREDFSTRVVSKKILWADIKICKMRNEKWNHLT